MITAEITVIPIGTESTSLSSYVAAAISVLEDMDVKYEINGVGTLIETDSIEKLFNAVKAMHEAVFTAGALRVSTQLKLDDRRDTQKTMQDKINSVKKSL